MAKKELKMFVLRKYIMAENAKQAIRMDKKKEVDDVWIDSDWQKKQFEQLASAIGFDNGQFPE